MKITIFEDSFDPPLRRDLTAAEELAEDCDILFIVPDNSSDSPNRLEMCRINFSSIANAEISDSETDRDGQCYIIETLDFFRNKYPDATFRVAAWQDEDISQWWRIDDVLEQCEIVIIDRDEGEASYESVREMLPLRLGSDFLEDSVYEYIIKNNCYDALPDLSWLREKVIDYIADKRLAHVAGCEQEAVRLARFWGEDEDTAATAGILHDITKKCSYDEQIQLINKYGISCDESELHTPKLLHAKTGAYLSKDLFGISDEIFYAIRYHTTGKPDMTLLEKIIYLADYIEPNRDFDGVEDLRKLAYDDLNECLRLGLQMSLEEIAAKGQEPYKDTKEAFEYYAAAE